jgi:hypothetical protein
LIRYECALLKNKVDRKLVFLVFLAEIVGKDDDSGELKFAPFDYLMDFPDVLHHRDDSTQTIIDALGYGRELNNSFVTVHKENTS